jgi:hypothetical protein
MSSYSATHRWLRAPADGEHSAVEQITPTLDYFSYPVGIKIHSFSSKSTAFAVFTSISPCDNLDLKCTEFVL